MKCCSLSPPGPITCSTGDREGKEGGWRERGGAELGAQDRPPQPWWKSHSSAGHLTGCCCLLPILFSVSITVFVYGQWLIFSAFNSGLGVPDYHL